MKDIPLTKKEKIAIIVGIGLLIIGFFSYLTFAGGTIGVSLQNSGGLGNGLGTGLIGYWTFDGKNMLSNVGDSSGSGLSGFLVGSTATTTVPGRVGGAFNFNGSNQYVNLGTPSTITAVRNNLTISAWINPTTLTGIQRIFASNASGGGFGFGTNGRNLRFTTFSILDYDTNTTQLSPGQWYHIVVVMDSSNNATFYVNGVSIQTISGTTQANAGTGVQIGRGNGIEYFSGAIDDLRLYNRSLSAAEVARLYSLGGGTSISKSQQAVGTLPSAPNSNSGLVAYYTFDGDKLKNNVTDSSGQGNNGYLAGFTSTTTTFGKIGQALNFNGTNQYADMGSSIGNFNNTDTFAVATWIKPSNLNSSAQGIVSRTNASSVGWQLKISPGNAVRFILTSSGVNYIGADSTALSNNKWYHVVGVWNGISAQVYVNGVLNSSPISNGTLGTMTGVKNLQIGHEAELGTYFSGSIDDTRIYNRALTAAEVSRLYQDGGGTSVSTSVNTSSATGNSLSTGLVGYWTFDGNNIKSNVTDSSGTGHTGYLTSFTSTTTTFGKIGQALQFNGTGNYVNVSSVPSVTNPHTVSAWVYPTSVSQSSFGSGVGGTILDENESGGAAGWILGIKNDNTIWFWPSGGNDKFSTGKIPLNTWTHIIAVYNGTNIVFYINGVLDSSQVTSAPQGSATFFRIGGKSWITGFWQGGLDDIRVYTRALSASEVARLYQLGK